MQAGARNCNGVPSVCGCRQLGDGGCGTDSLSFRSHHPTAHKVAVIRALMTRAENLSSSGVERTEEEKHVTDALRGNDYPSGFIQKHTISSRRNEEVEVERPQTTLTLPYIRGLSEAIKHVLPPWGSR